MPPKRPREEKHITFCDIIQVKEFKNTLEHFIKNHTHEGSTITIVHINGKTQKVLVNAGKELPENLKAFHIWPAMPMLKLMTLNTVFFRQTKPLKLQLEFIKQRQKEIDEALEYGECGEELEEEFAKLSTEHASLEEQLAKCETCLKEHQKELKQSDAKCTEYLDITIASPIIKSYKTKQGSLQEVLENHVLRAYMCFDSDFPQKKV